MGEPHKCPHCEFKSDTRFKLKKHQLKKHPDQNVQDPEKTCQYCHTEFFETLQLSRHICPARITAKNAIDPILPQNGRYYCPECNEGFESSPFLLGMFAINLITLLFGR